MRLPGAGERPPAIGARDGRPEFGFDPRSMIRELREELYAADPVSPTLALPFDYQVLPGFVRALAAKLVYLPRRVRRGSQDPSWPIAPGADLLLELAGAPRTGPWGGGRWALTVTHDVDTVHGLRRCPDLAAVVERFGFRSCFYIVGELVRNEPDLVRDLHDRGHEIGSHDVCHDNRLCFLSDSERSRRIREARDIVEPYGGCGFRSPSLLRTPRMLEEVGRHFAYDSSVCDTDLEYLRGCTTVFPFRSGNVLELPITLPMDSSLLYVGYSPDRVLGLWKRKCRYVRELGGLANLVTHAEPHLSGRGRMLATLERFLEWVRGQEDCLVELPGTLARQVTEGNPHEELP